MKAFHGDSKVKAKYLKRVASHRNADEIIKGKYWEEGKGCAVGCTIHGSDHSAYETELGIPGWLAKVEDTLFEGMPADKAKMWPVVFLKSINVGSNLESIRVPFLIHLMEGNLMLLDSLKVDSKFVAVIDAITQVKSAIRQTVDAHLSKDQNLIYSSALSAARLAASSAYSAVPHSAPRSAYSSYSAAKAAARSAYSAASSATFSADSAPHSAADYAASSATLWAASAADSAASSATFSAAYSAARSTHYGHAKYLLKLIRNCK